MNNILGKASTFLLALVIGFGAVAVGKAAPANAETYGPGYVVNVHHYAGDCTLSLVVSHEYRWTLWVDGRTVARVAKRKPDSPETTWFSGVLNVQAKRIERRVVLLRDGVRYFKMDLSKKGTCRNV